MTFGKETPTREAGRCITKWLWGLEHSHAPHHPWGCVPALGHELTPITSCAQLDEQRGTAAADQLGLGPHVKHKNILIISLKEDTQKEGQRKIFTYFVRLERMKLK